MQERNSTTYPSSAYYQDASTDERKIRARCQTPMWWFGLIPVLFVVILLVYPYVVFMYCILFPMFEKSIAVGTLVGLITHIFVFLLVWSYVQTLVSSPGYVPDDFIFKVCYS